MAAHNEVLESQIPYGQAVEFHIDSNKRRLSQEWVMTSELKSLESNSNICWRLASMKSEIYRDIVYKCLMYMC